MSSWLNIFLDLLRRDELDDAGVGALADELDEYGRTQEAALCRQEFWGVEWWAGQVWPRPRGRSRMHSVRLDQRAVDVMLAWIAWAEPMVSSRAWNSLPNDQRWNLRDTLRMMGECRDVLAALTAHPLTSARKEAIVGRLNVYVHQLRILDCFTDIDRYSL